MTSSGLVLSAGDSLTIQNGGVASNTVLPNGATEYDYGTTVGTVVSGGLEDVEVGGVASGTNIRQGSSNRTGEQDVSGTAVNTVVGTCGYEYVLGGGKTSTGLVLSSGDTLTILSGGVALGTVINSGAVEYDYGVASGAIVSGGEEYAEVGGVASSTQISGAVYTGNQSVSGVAVGTVVGSGGVVDVASGGVTRGATIGYRGSETVGSAGPASNTTVNSGGRLLVEAGGTNAGTTVGSGATERVY